MGADVAQKQLILVVEGTAAMGPFWQTILSDYLDKIVRCVSGAEAPGQKLPDTKFDLALVVYNTHGPYSGCLVRRSGWTRDADSYLQWLNSIPFCGGGFNDAAICEGLAEALMMFSGISNSSQSQPNSETRSHCVLVAASNPHPLPTPVYRTIPKRPEQKENSSDRVEACILDAESIAKSFAERSISISVISPKQLPKLKSIYIAGNQNLRTAESSMDISKNPQFLVLLSENFVEARSALIRPGTNNLQNSQAPSKIDGAAIPISTATLASVTSANMPGLSRQAVSSGNAPYPPVKMEPSSVQPTTSGPAFPQVSSIPIGGSQGIQTLVTSSSPASQEITSGVMDTVQDFKPVMNSQPQRPLSSGPANVNILNTLSQVRLNSSAITGGNAIALQNIGANPMAMHMSTMMSNGANSSGLSAQVSQNMGISSSITNMQGPIGVGQGNLNTGSQINQSGVNISQNVMSGLGSNGQSGSGTMIPTPGIIPQQVQPNSHSLGGANISSGNMPLAQTVSGGQHQKYVKIWEGDLSGQRQGQPMIICKLEGYRSLSASERLAEDWPRTMQIVRLISQDHMNNKLYTGKADFLVFRTLNQHGFLGQLQERKLCAVIQLPSQTLLLSIAEKASRLIGMLFPGDKVIFKPQISSQPQQQQQQQQLQQQQQIQQQQIQQQQLQQQQQQMVGPGMGGYVQGPGRGQMMGQGKVGSQPINGMPGSGFLP